RSRAAATMVTGLLAMRLSPLDEECGYRCEREIDDRQNPQTAPVACYLPQASAKLVYAHDTVDREIGREQVVPGENRPRDRFARPGEAGQEELWQAGANKDQRRGFRMLEPGAGCLAHKAGRQSEQRSEREQLQRLAQCGKAVDARQYDEKKRERRETNGQKRDPPARPRGAGSERRPPRCAPV